MNTQKALVIVPYKKLQQSTNSGHQVKPILNGFTSYSFNENILFYAI